MSSDLCATYGENNRKCHIAKCCIDGDASACWQTTGGTTTTPSNCDVYMTEICPLLKNNDACKCDFNDVINSGDPEWNALGALTNKNYGCNILLTCAIGNEQNKTEIGETEETCKNKIKQYCLNNPTDPACKCGDFTIHPDCKDLACCMKTKFNFACDDDKYMNSAACDVKMREYCDRINNDDPRCACLAASSSGWANPQCFNEKCATDGYKFPEHRNGVCSIADCATNRVLPKYADDKNIGADIMFCQPRQVKPNPAVEEAFQKVLNVSNLKMMQKPKLGSIGGDTCQMEQICDDTEPSALCGLNKTIWYDDNCSVLPLSRLSWLFSREIWVFIFIIIFIIILGIVATKAYGKYYDFKNKKRSN